jgi:uncharacterized membrane protein YoaK (UPF0700 family)
VLYGNESISHYNKSNVTLWMIMAFQAGLLNIGGFMACHRFVSHVTGFATFMGLEVSRGDYRAALGMLSVPVFFLLGAMLSGVLVDVRLKLHKRPKYYLSFALMFFLILIVFFGGVWGYFGPFGESLAKIPAYILLALLCLVCGIQNGTITSVSRSVVRTTHLTGITTDLGIGIVRYFNRKKFTEEKSGEGIAHLIQAEGAANLMRLGIIACFGLGSIAGGLLFSKFGYHAFALPALTCGMLFLFMYRFQRVKKSLK